MNTWIRGALFLLVAGAAARATVLIVDPSGGPGGAALLQAAIDAAQDGDILLLRPGDYGSVPGSHPQLVGKSLALIVDGPPGSVVLAGLSIGSSDPATQMLVRGLRVEPAPLVAQDGGAVELTGKGTYWFEDCVFTGSLASSGKPVPGLDVFLQAFVFPTLTLVRCTISGADGPDEVPGVSPAGAGAPGAIMQFSFQTSIHECTIRGGRGGDGDPFASGGSSTADGGPGLAAVSVYPMSFLGSTILGGDEGENNPAATKPGAGISCSFVIIDRRDSVFQAGAINGAGTPADDMAFGPGVGVIAYPASTRSMSVPSPLREGESSLLHAQGEVGDDVWIYLGLGSGLDPVMNAQGNIVLEDALPSPSFLGTITDPSGVLDYPFQMPNLPPGLDGFLIYMQSAMTRVGGAPVVGSGTALTWLDSSL